MQIKLNIPHIRLFSVVQLKPEKPEMPGYLNISNVKRKQKSIIIGYSFATWCETAAGIRFYIVYIV